MFTFCDILHEAKYTNIQFRECSNGKDKVVGHGRKYKIGETGTR